MRDTLCLIVFGAALAAWFTPAQVQADEKPAPVFQRRLVMAFASHRERPAFANIYLYRHDAVGKGELASSSPSFPSEPPGPENATFISTIARHRGWFLYRD